MAKGIGYYEHYIKVRFTEERINKSSNWQWLIDCTEERFSAPKEITSVNEFIGVLTALHEPFAFLATVVDLVGDFKPNISSMWLVKLYDCVLLRSGMTKPEDYDEDVGFFGMLGVASYATFLFNKLTGRNALIDTRPIFYSNLHQLYDFTALNDEWPKLEYLTGRINLTGIELVAATLRHNFKCVDAPINCDSVIKLMDDNFDADFLSFRNVDRDLFQTWQEALLCDAFRSSYQNGKLIPLIGLAEGEESSYSSAWTEGMFQKAKDVFEDDRAICLLESIEFAKWNEIPSTRSQTILVELTINNAKRIIKNSEPLYRIQCTAIDIVTQLKRESKLCKEAQTAYFRSMNELLKDRTDYNDLRYMSEHSIPMTREQKGLLKTKCQAFFAENLKKVNTTHDLVALFENPLSAKYCNQKDAAYAFDLFYKHAEHSDIETAELFYSAMMFLLDVLSNPEVNNNWAKNVIIALRHTWQDKYYSQVVSGMHCFTREFSIPNTEIKMLNKQFLESPHGFAQSLLQLSDDSISSSLEDMSKKIIVYLFGKTTVSEFYPNHVHVMIEDDARSIDKMIADEVKRVYKERSYRFINRLGEQVMLDGFFEKLNKNIQLVCSMVVVEPVYDKVVTLAPSQYELLPNPGNRPTLGHLTQLFPILENTIRNIGEMFSIVPFQANRDSFNKLREVSGVLADLIGSVRELTGTIQGCGEFLFVYLVMYSSNGYNIRNDCIHGRQYQGSADVAFAYRLTVICTYMMLKRLQGLETIVENEVDSKDQEEIVCHGRRFFGWAAFKAICSSLKKFMSRLRIPKTSER